MRSLLSALMVALIAAPAMAVPVPVPEPGTLGLMLAGLGAAALVSRRRQK